MTITGLIAGIVLLLVTLYVLAQPFLQHRQHQKGELSAAVAQKQRDELLTSYERILATIRDLDEDHSTGKLPPETYQQERAYWTEQGILLLQQLEPDVDVLNSETPVVEPVEKPVADKALDEAIEKAIAEYRKAGASQ
jgi:hypothetical protein